MPLKPSSLRGLTSPTSPSTPISPRTPADFPNLLSPRAKPTNAFSLSNQIAMELPSIPMPWVWSCHRCNTRYLLGATRRCLLDGHYFCGGITVEKFSGKLKQHKACISEFDYGGWEDFGRWKRVMIGQVVSRHCHDKCTFPSACHWKGQHATQQIGSACVRRSYLDKESDTSPINGILAVPKSTDNHISKIGSAVEKRTIQVAKAILPPIEEKDQKAPSFVNTRLDVNGLSFHNTVMEFLASRNDAN